MLIRSAVPNDVPAVLPMVAQICALHETWDSAKYGFLPNPAQRYERWLKSQARSDRSVFLVAEAAEATEPQTPDASTVQLVGFIIATIESEIPIYRIKEYGFIHDLWIEPDYRRGGLARQMVLQTIERFRQLGVEQIRLDTSSPNEAARQLFASCGFRVSTIEMLMEL